ncbi:MULTISPECIES: hypothetical protein [unclassified Streptomyces]|uniref:hypothetical protein n=1 Tax=unclassified Streptomyces TaxID=2593676 RepID=UPI002E766C14|nr:MULTISPECIES: hypothetical protein [unclassified Streptomyces]MEE1759197.1 hypothetical protein [Streptomyces sp. SP18BB07]MEE1830596.1 hypothetical protein [Streptomyces sp. SP17KL33]
MQSESANEYLTPEQRKGAAEEGPVFVDNSGRRARLLRRCGMLLGAVCLGYAVVLGMAFMGWGISASPTELFPFGGGGGQAGAPGGGGGDGPQPQGGVAPEGLPTGVPTGAPSGAPHGTPPSGAPTAVPSPSASAG